VNLTHLVTDHDLRAVTGVLHLGAHYGEEADDYDTCLPWTAGPRVVWVEGDTDHLARLGRHVGHRPGHSIVPAMIDDQHHDVTFHLASNDGASSSLLPFGTHATVLPHIRFVGERTERTTTVDYLASMGGWDDLNLLTLDLQGMELAALHGAAGFLGHVDYIVCEVNEAELYVGCPMVEQIDAHLADFERVVTEWTTYGYGDAFYRRIQ
jgi:FkbM family methyltransferase